MREESKELLREWGFSAPRENDDVAACERLDHACSTVERRALAGAGKVRTRYEGRKPSVPRHPTREKHEVFALGISTARAWRACRSRTKRSGARERARESGCKPCGKR